MSAAAVDMQDLNEEMAGTVLVLGMGVSGASMARWLAAQGARACFADSRAGPPGLADIRQAFAGRPDRLALSPGGIPERLPDGVVRVLVSPGVSLDLPLLAEARSRGLPVESDIDLFSWAAHAPVIAITGSNGKSTVTSMTGAMLAGAGWKVAVGGNLGTPALDLLDPVAQAYVLELSSFQIERSLPVPAAAAVVLNLSADHLDIHGDMATYRAAKARIYADCRTAVVNRDAADLAELVPAGVPVVSFGLGLPEAGQFGLRATDDGLWIAHGWELLAPVHDLPVIGRHNVSNALAALALGTSLGVPAQALLAGLRNWQPLPHRMAVVGQKRGVTWIDDSKATNVGAAVASLGSVDDPLVLIAGGDGKGAEFSGLAAALRGRDCEVILLGRDAPLIAATLEGVCPVHGVGDMKAAVELAARRAVPGATVLLAPACSSLDMYSSYAARGRDFAAAVQALDGGGRR